MESNILLNESVIMEEPVNGEVASCVLVPLVAAGVIETCMVGVVSYVCNWLAIAA